MKIETNTGEHTIVDLSLHTLDLRTKILRSVKAFGLFFLLAMFSVLIPVLHFFLVPIFLIISIYRGYTVYIQNYSVDLTNLACPKCHNKLKDSVCHYKESPLRLFCYKCQSSLRVWIESEN